MDKMVTFSLRWMSGQDKKLAFCSLFVLRPISHRNSKISADFAGGCGWLLRLKGQVFPLITPGLILKSEFDRCRFLFLAHKHPIFCLWEASNIETADFFQLFFLFSHQFPSVFALLSNGIGKNFGTIHYMRKNNRQSF